MPLQRWQTILVDPLKEGVEGEFFVGASACTIDNLLTSVGHEVLDGGVKRRFCRPCTSLSTLRAR